MTIPELITTYAPLSYGLAFVLILLTFLLALLLLLSFIPSRVSPSGVCGGGADFQRLKEINDTEETV